MIDLSILDEVSTQKARKPSDYEFILYLFFDKGIGLEEFNRLPIPYILSVIKTHNYVKEKEAEAYKRR
jgi:hypothetical protein